MIWRLETYPNRQRTLIMPLWMDGYDFFSWPQLIVADPGGEFAGFFAHMLGCNGVCILPTDAKAPWQNGRTERAGHEWKRQLKTARRKYAISSDRELLDLGAECTAARNRHMNRSGFTPMQRVFGITARLPASILSDDLIDPAYLVDNPSE